MRYSAVGPKPGTSIVIRYATGEAAMVGDHVINDVWKSVVEAVIASPEETEAWGLGEPGLMLRCKEAGLMFEPLNSGYWDAIVFERRATG
ncbi:MAG: hypothetical protein IT450_16595 [Phycisphaerales bacterium]|nr:hypothetical protein [Phycisphaerales bacterium]